MPIFTGQIPDAILDKIADPADRRKMGKAGLTMAERSAKEETRLERELHSQFSGFLKRNESKTALVIHADPTKPARMTPGVPDYTIFFRNGRVLFVEFKVGRNWLTPEQTIIIAQLRESGFPVLITSSYEFVTDVFNRLSL
jgi:hypothetical protein